MYPNITNSRSDGPARGLLLAALSARPRGQSLQGSSSTKPPPSPRRSSHKRPGKVRGENPGLSARTTLWVLKPTLTAAGCVRG